MKLTDYGIDHVPEVSFLIKESLSALWRLEILVHVRSICVLCFAYGGLMASLFYRYRCKTFHFPVPLFARIVLSVVLLRSYSRKNYLTHEAEGWSRFGRSFCLDAVRLKKVFG